MLTYSYYPMKNQADYLPPECEEIKTIIENYILSASDDDGMEEGGEV